MVLEFLAVRSRGEGETRHESQTLAEVDKTEPFGRQLNLRNPVRRFLHRPLIELGFLGIIPVS